MGAEVTKVEEGGKEAEGSGSRGGGWELGTSWKEIDLTTKNFEVISSS